MWKWGDGAMGRNEEAPNNVWKGAVPVYLRGLMCLAVTKGKARQWYSTSMAWL